MPVKRLLYVYIEEKMRLWGYVSSSSCSQVLLYGSKTKSNSFPRREADVLLWWFEEKGCFPRGIGFRLGFQSSGPYKLLMPESPNATMFMEYDFCCVVCLLFFFLWWIFFIFKQTTLEKLVLEAFVVGLSVLKPSSSEVRVSQSLQTKSELRFLSFPAKLVTCTQA